MYVAYAALMIMCRCAWYPLYTIFRCRLGVDEAIASDGASPAIIILALYTWLYNLHSTFPTRP